MGKKNKYNYYSSKRYEDSKTVDRFIIGGLGIGILIGILCSSVVVGIIAAVVGAGIGKLIGSIAVTFN
jgi:hypothetical protein